MTPRVISGLGVVSPLGIGKAAFFEALRTGMRAAGRPQTFDGDKYAAPARVAEVPGFDAAKYLGDKGLRTLDRLTKLMVVAARLALEDAGLKAAGVWATPPDGARPWPERLGLVMSNAYGSIEAITELDRVAVLEDPRYINPSRFPLTVSNSAAGYVSIWEDLRALNVTVSDGNCGGVDAVACADLLLSSLRAGALLVGGAEAMTELLFAAFGRLVGGSALEGQPLRLGEGSALMVIETPEAAAARRAPALAEIVGYGTAFEPPDGAGALVHASSRAAERAIADAIGDAAAPPEAIDLVVSSVSGMTPFDDAELSAITRTIGDAACVVAPKLAFGETFGAGAALAMLAALGYLREGVTGYEVRGTLRGRARTLRTVLVTSLGYYGNASALVMRTTSG